MNEAPRAGARPSTVAITKMLAEAEVARRRALRPWLLATLLPLLLGGALIAFTSYAVYTRLAELKRLNEEQDKITRQIMDNAETIRQQEEQLKKLKEELTVEIAVAEDAIKRLPESERLEVVSAAVANPSAATTPRVFIHYPTPAQKGTAEQVRGAIRGLGYIVPAAELVTSTGANAEVRYFFPDDRETAEKVAGVLSGQSMNLRTARRSAPGARPGLVEVWLPAGAAGATPQPTDNRNPRADAVRDRTQRLEEGVQNSNRTAQNANRPAARPRPGQPAYPARPPQ